MSNCVQDRGILLSIINRKKLKNLTGQLLDCYNPVEACTVSLML